jgi:hypothetical protein
MLLSKNPQNEVYTRYFVDPGIELVNRPNVIFKTLPLSVYPFFYIKIRILYIPPGITEVQWNATSRYLYDLNREPPTI